MSLYYILLCYAILFTTFCWKIYCIIFFLISYYLIFHDITIDVWLYDISYYIMLYCIALSYPLVYYTVVDYTKLYSCTTKHSISALYNIILHQTNLFHTISYQTKKKCYSIVEYGIGKYSTVWYSKVLYCILFQWPFQEPKLEVPTMYKAYVRPM